MELWDGRDSVGGQDRRIEVWVIERHLGDARPGSLCIRGGEVREQVLENQTNARQIVVFFSHPRGVSRHGWGWTHVYEIPKDGVLLVRGDPPRGFNVQEWLYVDSYGRKTSIVSEDSSTPTSTGNDTRVRGGELRAQTTYADGHARAEHSYRWIEAQIGRPADEASFGLPAHFVVEQVIEELRRQDRQGSGTNQ